MMLLLCFWQPTELVFQVSKPSSAFAGTQSSAYVGTQSSAFA
jgi:hypothetical protein